MNNQCCGGLISGYVSDVLLELQLLFQQQLECMLKSETTGNNKLTGSLRLVPWPDPISCCADLIFLTFNYIVHNAYFSLRGAHSECGTFEVFHHL